MRSWWFQSPEGRIQLSIIAIRLALLAVVVFVSIVSVPPANWPAFILAVSGFYLSVLDPLLRRARLVVDQDFAQIKACEGRGCTLLFADHTRGHARRWCSMGVCGNRAKVLAHRNRKKAH